jgi:dynein heavy chain
MMVGATMTGKSTLIKILAHSLKCQLKEVNPKAVTGWVLFGMVEPVTGEWRDGVAAKVVRDLVEERIVQAEARREDATLGEWFYKDWVLFDGPVDSIWI